MARRDPKYGRSYQALRKRWAREVDAGVASCVRCHRPILPDSKWHLDHTDDGAAYLGPSHARCNVGSANRRRASLAKAAIAAGL